MPRQTKEGQASAGWAVQPVADVVVRTAHYVVAGVDAPAHVRRQADFVCDGVADDEEINEAISLLNYGGTAFGRGHIHLAGVFYLSHPVGVGGIPDITAINGCKITGSGYSTSLQYTGTDPDINFGTGGWNWVEGLSVLFSVAGTGAGNVFRYYSAINASLVDFNTVGSVTSTQEVRPGAMVYIPPRPFPPYTIVDAVEVQVVEAFNGDTNTLSIGLDGGTGVELGTVPDLTSTGNKVVIAGPSLHALLKTEQNGLLNPNYVSDPGTTGKAMVTTRFHYVNPMLVSHL